MDETHLMICGGRTYHHGYIYKSDDGGKSWQLSYTNDRLSINTLYLDENNSFWAAGDSLKLYKSTDKGSSWEEYPLSNYPWSNYKNPYHAIYAWNDKEILAVGGEYYQKGITSKTETGNWPWKQTSWDNQWFDLQIFKIDEVLISGYGEVLYSNNKGRDWFDTNLYGDAFVDIETNSYEEIFLIGEHGEIYRYNNQSWVRVARLKGTFNALAFSEHHAIAAGHHGNLWFGGPHCDNWQKTEPFTDAGISAIRSIGDNFLIGCEKRLSFPLKL